MVKKFDDKKSLEEIKAEIEQETADLQAKIKIYESKRNYQDNLVEYEARFIENNFDDETLSNETNDANGIHIILVIIVFVIVISFLFFILK